MLSAALKQLAQDPGITPDAYRVIMYVVSLGDGEHEIPADTLRMLLRCRGDKPLYEARAIAERYGLTWRLGGKSHPNRYAYLAPQGELSPAEGALHGSKVARQGEVSESAPEDRSPPEPTVSDTVASQGDLSEVPRPSLVAPQGDSRGLVALQGDPKEGERGTTGGEGKIPVVHVTGPLTQQEQQHAGAHAHEGSPFGVSDRAAELIRGYDDKFSGFRGALRDYLSDHVNPKRQSWYVQTIATWLAGRDQSVFRLADGSRAPPEEIRGLLATALNELSAQGEESMKYKPGDIRNLRTKLNILCLQRGDHERRKNGAGHGGEPAETPGGKAGRPAVGIGANQPKHTYEQ